MRQKIILIWCLLISVLANSQKMPLRDMQMLAGLSYETTEDFLLQKGYKIETVEKTVVSGVEMIGHLFSFYDPNLGVTEYIIVIIPMDKDSKFKKKIGLVSSLSTPFENYKRQLVELGGKYKSEKMIGSNYHRYYTYDDTEIDFMIGKQENSEHPIYAVYLKVI